MGNSCLVFAIARASNDGGTTSVRTGAYFDPICEGSAPPPPSPTGAVTLDQAETPTLTWDARELEAHTACVDCAPLGWGNRTYDVALYRSVPVSSGTYRATFGVLDSPLTGCTLYSGTLVCGGTGQPGWPHPAELSLCQAARTLSVDFVLPESGDVDVDVTN